MQLLHEICIFHLADKLVPIELLHRVQCVDLVVGCFLNMKTYIPATIILIYYAAVTEISLFAHQGLKEMLTVKDYRKA